MEREMNFFDLCVVCGKAIGRCCSAIGCMLSRMVRLTYRYWWIVLTLMALAICAALYYTRKDNTIYKLDAVALLNGATVPQFEQRYAALRTGKMLPADAAITPFIKDEKAGTFKTYRVIDCLDDGTADYVDYKRKSVPTDTVKVQMQDRLCLQFRVKSRDLALVPEIEQAVLAYLNADEAMQQSYQVYLANLREEVQFNHTQAHKLDSLTSAYYFNNPAIAQPDGLTHNSGVSFYGDRRIRLFLNEIYEQQKHMQQCDYRMQLATAPVVLENHFAVNLSPVNGRFKCVILFLLLGWILGCVIAELIDKRKVIVSWLQQ